MCEVSVAIPLFNSESYIGEVLDSVITQITDVDYEIVVSDDASIDNSVSIVNGYMKKHGNIKLLTHQENTRSRGKESYLNLYEACRGKYIVHLDSDDIMLPGRIQSQYKLMENNPECAIGYGNAYVFNDMSGETLYSYNEHYYNYEHIPDKAKLEDFLMYGTFLCNSTKICRKSAVDFTGLKNIFSEVQHYIDLLMHLSMARNGCVIRDNNYVARYRLHGKSVCAKVRQNFDKRVEAYISMEKIIDYFSTQENLSRKTVNVAKINNCLATALYFLKHGNAKKFEFYLNKCALIEGSIDGRYIEILKNRNDYEKVLRLVK